MEDMLYALECAYPVHEVVVKSVAITSRPKGRQRRYSAMLLSQRYGHRVQTRTYETPEEALEALADKADKHPWIKEFYGLDSVRRRHGTTVIVINR